jgi:L-lactate dehydrogenase complex protein LldF
MGIERLVPAPADLSVMLQVLARSATGQKLSVYTSLITGPRRAASEPDGPDELHVVLVDNGRSRILGSGIAEILCCIRCGACLNVCPVYRAIGGHAYGSVYSGPVGAVLTPALAGGESAGELPQASSLCGACRDVCPVRIDLPALLLRLRYEAARAGRSPRWLRFGMSLFRFAALRPSVFRGTVRLGRLALRVLERRGGWVRRLPPPLSGWTEHRDFPVFAARPFHRQLKAYRAGREDSHKEGEQAGE